MPFLQNSFVTFSKTVSHVSRALRRLGIQLSLYSNWKNA